MWDWSFLVGVTGRLLELGVMRRQAGGAASRVKCIDPRVVQLPPSSPLSLPPRLLLFLPCPHGRLELFPPFSFSAFSTLFIVPSGVIMCQQCNIFDCCWIGFPTKKRKEKLAKLKNCVLIYECHSFHMKNEKGYGRQHWKKNPC